MGANFSEDARLYLTPSGLTFDRRASLSLPLAGGPLAFSVLNVIIRGGGKRLYQASFPVASLPALKQTLPEAFGERIEALVHNLTSARKDMAVPGHAPLIFSAPLIMGILNLTPDSFSDGGDFSGAAAVKRATDLFDQGADILDVGAESTRPGAKKVSVEEELQRLDPILEEINNLPGPVSIDTRKAEVMVGALTRGAAIINDVSALSFDAGALDAVKEAAGVVLMHAQGPPETMQENPAYGDVLLDVYDYLEARIEACEAAGIGRDRLIVDPGIGFGKTTAHNLELLRGLALLQGLGCPVLVGVSRKRFLGELTGVSDPKLRFSGGVAASLLALGQGAQVIRCHDVAGMRQALSVFTRFTAG